MASSSSNIGFRTPVFPSEKLTFLYLQYHRDTKELPKELIAPIAKIFAEQTTELLSILLVLAWMKKKGDETHFNFDQYSDRVFRALNDLASITQSGEVDPLYLNAKKLIEISEEMAKKAKHPPPP